MTSKEALEKIEQYITNEKGRLCFFIKLYLGTIKQDLERLETLELENIYYKSELAGCPNCSKTQQNEKLKKANFILLSRNNVFIMVVNEMQFFKILDKIYFYPIETLGTCNVYKTDEYNATKLKKLVRGAISNE